MKYFKNKLIIMAALLIFTMSIPTMAQTKEYAFDLKLNDSAAGATATKAGGDNFEKKYYLTQKSIASPQNATRRFLYYPKYNGDQMAKSLNLSTTDFSKHNNSYYNGKAIAGRQYKLYCKCTGKNKPNKYASVSGRWTP